MFLHYGIIHLVLNMYALYVAASILEPMLGSFRFLTAYLCMGVLASIASLWWHGAQPVVSAGASGAVFGLFGLLLALLSTSLIPKQVRNGLLQSFGIFILFNLIYGMRNEGIDNAAHIGGLFAGLAIGYLYYFQMKKETAEPDTQGGSSGARFVLPLVLIALTTAAVWATQQNKLIPNSIVQSEKFTSKIEQFSTIEDLTLEMMDNRDNLPETEYVEILKKKVVPNWTDCASLMDEAAELKLTERQEKIRSLLRSYSGHRIEETLLLIRIFEQKKEEDVEKLNQHRKEMQDIIQELKTMSGQK